MSLGNMQHQLQQQQLHLQQSQSQLQSPSQPELQQHPLLSAISGNNNYAETQRVHYPWHHHQLHQQQHPLLPDGRPLLGATSNHNGAWASASSGHSGYGMDPSVEYEVQQTPPSGSYSSFHSSGTGHSGPAYSPPHPPPHHAPKTTSTSKKKKKKKSSAGSVMSALTLLSFFFFVNMLQNCIKEHISDINPTVMVLTASGSRNRFNKLAEMNSREQASSPASTTASSAASSWQQAALAPVPPAVSSVVAPIIVTPAVTLHTPYSSGLVTNKPASHTHSHYQPAAPQQQHQHHHQQQQHPDDDYNYGHRTPYAAATPAPATTLDFYPNRTHIDHSLRPDSDYYQQQQQQQQQPPPPYYSHEGDRQHYMNSDSAWSYGAMGDSSHLASHPAAPFSYAAGSKRYSSSASLGAQSGVSSYSDNARYRQLDDYDHHQHRHHHRYNINARHDEVDDDVDNGDADHRRRGITDDFYTRNN